MNQAGPLDSNLIKYLGDLALKKWGSYLSILVSLEKLQLCSSPREIPKIWFLLIQICACISVMHVAQELWSS